MTLAARRLSYNRTLTTPFTAYRDVKDSAGISVGGLGQAVTPVYGYCGVNLQGGGAGASSFVQSIRQAMTAKVPGGRTLSFAWNEDVRVGDIVVIGTTKYQLSSINTDDPQRIGIQVDTEAERVNA